MADVAVDSRGVVHVLDGGFRCVHRYAADGGSVRTEVIPGSTHGPHIDNEARWSELFWGFVRGV